jgi:hypothetical protein
MSDVRVVHGDFIDVPQRTAPQKMLDTILENAEEAADDAKTLLEEAIEWLGLVKPSTHRTLPTLVGQLVEEIREVRRMRQ